MDAFCDMCNEAHVTKKAEHWCPECEEGFCSDCLKYHGRMKSTKSHDVISIESYKRLPSSLPKLSRHCSDHGKEYQIYCADHECLCCSVCAITTHKKCIRLMPIDEAIKTSKTSVSMGNLESALTNMDANITLAKTDRELNIKNIDEQGQKFHEEIKNRRKMINSYLDQMEEKLHDEVNTEKDRAKSRLQSTLQRITENGDKVKALQQNLLAVKTYGSDIQTFLWCRTLETEMLQQEISIKSLEQDGSLHKISLELQFEPKISDLSTIQVFGIISTQIEPQSVVLRTNSEEQAQIMSAVGHDQRRNINDIKITMKTKFNVMNVVQWNRGFILRRSVFCSNGKMIFVDGYNNWLFLVNENGTLNKKITCISSDLYDVTNITDKTVAVATIEGVKIIDLATGRQKESISTMKSCFGIVHHEECLFLCHLKKGIQKIELSNMNISTLVGRESISYWSYIAINKDKLYVTNMDTHAVTCYSTKGQKIWEHTDQSIRTPRCIAVDSDSNVYVVSEENKSIVIISSDGKKCRKLLSMPDGKSQLWGICYDKVQNNLLVSFTDGLSFLYNVL